MFAAFFAALPLVGCGESPVELGAVATYPRARCRVQRQICRPSLGIAAAGRCVRRDRCA